MKKKGRKILKLTIVIFVIILVLVGGFFGVKAYNKWRLKRDLAIFEQGFTYGYTNAVMYVMNASNTCEPFPVYIGDKSRDLIAVDCL